MIGRAGSAPGAPSRAAGPGRGRVAGALLCAAWLCVALMPVARAAQAPPPPPDLARRAGFDQLLGGQVPRDAGWRDASGKRTDLRALAHGKPLLLALGYYRCPNLCDVVLNGMAHALAGQDLEPGRDFEVAFVSIDPSEQAADARHAQAMLARTHPDAHAARWHFLTGDQASITALARAIGFRYFHDERLRQYAHPAGSVLITPDGRIAQYFLGVSWPPASLRLALVSASQGRLGGLVDRLVLLCCGYDPTTGRYSLAIGRAMQVLGVAFLLAFAGWLVWLKARARA